MFRKFGGKHHPMRVFSFPSNARDSLKFRTKHSQLCVLCVEVWGFVVLHDERKRIGSKDAKERRGKNRTEKTRQTRFGRIFSHSFLSGCAKWHSYIVLNLKFEAITSTCHVLFLLYPTKRSRIRQLYEVGYLAHELQGFSELRIYKVEPQSPVSSNIGCKFMNCSSIN